VSLALMLTLNRNIFLIDTMTKQGHWIKCEIERYLLAKEILNIFGLVNIGYKLVRWKLIGR